MTKENEQEPPKLSDDEKVFLQAVAFNKIYNALHHAQLNSNPFKTSFIHADGNNHLGYADLIDKVQAHAQEAPDSRTAQAWRLTQKYYLDCHNTNPDLVNEVLQCAWGNTRHFGVRWFSALVGVQSFTKEQVETKEYAVNNRQGMCIKFNLRDKEEISSLLKRQEVVERFHSGIVY
jgi:hypothetical protein